MKPFPSQTNASTRCERSSLAAAASRPAPAATVRRSERQSTSVATPVYVSSTRARLDTGLPSATTAVCEFTSIQRWRRRHERQETLLRTPRLAAGPRTLRLSRLDDSFTDTEARMTAQFEVAFIPRKAGPFSPANSVSGIDFLFAVFPCCSQHCKLHTLDPILRDREREGRERKIFRRRRAQPETAKSRCSSTRRPSPSCNTPYSSILLAVEQEPPHTRLASPRYATSTANRTLRGRFSATSFIVIRTPRLVWIMLPNRQKVDISVRSIHILWAMYHTPLGRSQAAGWRVARAHAKRHVSPSIKSLTRQLHTHSRSPSRRRSSSRSTARSPPRRTSSPTSSRCVLLPPPRFS